MAGRDYALVKDGTVVHIYQGVGAVQVVGGTNPIVVLKPLVGDEPMAYVVLGPGYAFDLQVGERFRV